MNFGNTAESKNFQDDTNPTGLQYVKNVVGNYLYKHQWVRGANNQYYNPAQDAAYQQSRNQPMPQLDAQGRRADIDWGSNASIPGATPLMSAVTGKTRANPNDAMAQRMGFHDAATAAAYYQKQQAMRTGPANVASSASSDGSWLGQQLAKIPIHPSYLLGKVTDAFTKAGQ